MPVLILWLPVLAVLAHLVEEFAWPGGFAEWYRHYPPGRTAVVTTRLLVLINVLFLGLAMLPPLLGATPRGLAFWLVVAAVAAINALFHVVATARTRAYAPGVVTAVVLYLPLAPVGGWLVRTQPIAGGTVAQAILMALAYQAWSTWNHRRAVV